MTEYTGPERFTERQLAARLRELIRKNPCRHCVHRLTGWGRSVCMASRTYPECTEYGSPAFELDPTTIIVDLEKAA